MKLSVLFARFPFGASEHPDVGDWLVETVLAAKADPRIGDIFHHRVDDTPITMGRNRVVELARRRRADLLCMIDSDMGPDCELGRDPLAKPFWPTALDWVTRHPGPCVVAAPYCGPPPVSNVYVFRWASAQNRDANPQPDLRLEQFSREEAAQRAGVERVAALPTGLILIDMRAFDHLEPPYFYYEWADKTESEKASTEDVVFTRNLDLAGVPQYVAWDCWARHHKRVGVDKPRLLAADDVSEQFRAAARRGLRRDERQLIVTPDGVAGNGRGEFVASRPPRLAGA